MRRLISIESLGQIAGLILCASAIHKSIIKEDFDPVPRMTIGIALMSGAYLAPTQKIDEKIQQATESIDRIIKD